MKTPRIEDFDPKAAPTLGSPMDNLPHIEKPVRVAAPPPTTLSVEKPPEPPVVTPGLPQPSPENKTMEVKDGVVPVQEIKKERILEIKKERFHSFLQPFLKMRAASMVSFRYPEDLMNVFEDIQYTIHRQHGVKLTKNAILVAALAYVLWDYEQKGKESLLYTQLVENHA